MQQILEAKSQLYGHLPPITQIIQDEQDILRTTTEVRTNSYVTFSYKLLQIDAPGWVDQQGLIPLGKV